MEEESPTNQTAAYVVSIVALLLSILSLFLTICNNT